MNLEQKLHDLIAKECKGQEEDIDELRKLMGGEELARKEHHVHILTTFEAEKAKRDASHSLLHGRLEEHGNAMQKHIDDRLALQKVERDGMHKSLQDALGRHRDEVDRVAQVDDGQVREIFSTPRDFGFLDGDASVPKEQELRHVGVCQPVSVGINSGRVVRW